MREPQSELSRYAFGYSDKKPSLAFWIIHAVMLAFVIYAIFISPSWSAACHKYSIWKYPWPQKCAVTVQRLAQAYAPSPLPPENPCRDGFPEMCFAKDIKPDIDIPLPSLENMEFPPDCIAEWCQRLKGIGKLREIFQTN